MSLYPPSIPQGPTRFIEPTTDRESALEGARRAATAAAFAKDARTRASLLSLAERYLDRLSPSVAGCIR